MLNNIFRRLPHKYQYSNIKISTDSQRQVAFLTLAQEKKRNPLSLETIKEIYEGLEEIENRIEAEKLKILIMRGEGSVFSAGHDLIELKNTRQPENIFNQCAKTMVKLRRFTLITLCAVNNMATAAGLQLALTCDLILATKSASFGIPGMKRGLFPSTPLVQLQRSSKSPALNRQICLIGDMLTAEEAYQRGIVNKVVQDGQLDTQVNGYIEKASKLSGEVIALGKRVLNLQEIQSLQQAYCTATLGMKVNIEDKEDCRQGLLAFAEKRHPNFKN